jgi:hypothetical protein
VFRLGGEKSEEAAAAGNLRAELGISVEPLEAIVQQQLSPASAPIAVPSFLASSVRLSGLT